MADTKMIDKVLVYCDGGSRGNPGPSALGVVIKTTKGKIIEEIGEFLGEQTNNYAEYMAVVKAMEYIKEKGIKSAEFYLDSQLVVRQLNGEYKIKSDNIKHLNQRVNQLRSDVDVSFEHVYRENNKEADAVVNQVLDSIK
jgi:ribonuclease HI